MYELPLENIFIPHVLNCNFLNEWKEEEKEINNFKFWVHTITMICDLRLIIFNYSNVLGLFNRVEIKYVINSNICI